MDRPPRGVDPIYTNWIDPPVSWINPPVSWIDPPPVWVPFGTRVTALSWSNLCVLCGNGDVFLLYTPLLYTYHIYIYMSPVRAKPTAVRGWGTVPGHATAAAKALRSCVAWYLLHLLTCIATAVAASLFGAETVKFFFFCRLAVPPPPQQRRGAPDMLRGCTIARPLFSSATLFSSLSASVARHTI
jgi:hypothetical protein